MNSFSEAMRAMGEQLMLRWMGAGVPVAPIESITISTNQTQTTEYLEVLYTDGLRFTASYPRKTPIRRIIPIVTKRFVNTGADK